MDNNELRHHGTKGMKWGIRRYQNKDGSLTAAGKKRQAQNLEKARSAKEAKKQHEEAKQKAVKSGSASELLKFKGELTKQEMDSAWARIQWEQNISGVAAKEAAAKGKAIFDKIDKATGYAVTAAKAWNMFANVMNATSKTLLPKIDTDIVKGNRGERKAEQREKQKAAEAQRKRDEQEAQRESKQRERAEKRAKQAKDDTVEKVSGEVVGVGNSSRNSQSKSTKRKSDYSDIIDGYGEWIVDTPVSEARNSRQAAIGQSVINDMFLLEDKSGGR